MEIIFKEWIEQVKYYIHLIADYPMKETPVGSVLEDVLNLSGKMLRSKLLLLCSFLGTDYEKNKETICKLAAMTELTHLASLIHDDIVDDSPYRRGKISIQGKYGKDTAVFAGDFLMARIYYYEAIEHLNESASILSKTVEHMCIGEISQNLCRYHENITEEEYFENIYGKTAALFQAACYIGAKEGGCSEEIIQKLKLFGKNLGLMFQLKDDILDFYSNSKEIGKETHKDFQNGIYTFPVIMALKNPKAKEVLLPIIKKNREKKLAATEIAQLENYIVQFGGIKTSYEKIRYLSAANKQLIKDLKQSSKVPNYLEKILNDLEV